MTTQEMHIALDILLQKSNSNWNKNFLPQEKDFFLNRETIKFIKQRMGRYSNSKRQGAFDTDKRITDLSALLETTPTPVVKTLTKEATVLLPFDFMFYVSTELEVIQNCDPASVPVNTYNVASSRFKAFTKTSAITTAYIDLEDPNYTRRLFDHTMLPADYLPQDGLKDYQKDFVYNNAVFALIQKNLPYGYEFQFDNKTQEFVISSYLKEYFYILIDVNGLGINSSDYEADAHTITGETLEATLEIVDEEFKPFIKNSTLSASKGKHYKGWLREDNLVMLQPKNALVKTARITYIRLPRKIDLLLGMNPELPDIILDEIISNTAETMKAIISSDTYEKFAANNQLIE